MKSAAAEWFRAVMPRITPRLILLALLGVLLFLCGILYGGWLIIRFRHHDRDVA